MDEAQKKKRQAAHKEKLTAKQIRQIKQKHDNRIYALVKFGTLLFSYIISSITCTTFFALNTSLFVMSLSIASDMLIILHTTLKTEKQFNISVAITIYAFALATYFLLGCFNLVTYSAQQHILTVGKDIAFSVSWEKLKFINLILTFVSMGSYSLEHTGILKMPITQTIK